MLANYLHARALADERHQVVTGEEALRVMHEANLKAVERVAGWQQLEAAEVRGQDQRALAGISRRELVPYVEAIIGDAPPEPAIEESTEPTYSAPVRPRLMYDARRMRSRSAALFSGKAISRLRIPIFRCRWSKRWKIKPHAMPSL